MRPEPLRDAEQVVGRLVDGSPFDRCAEVRADPHDGRRLDRGADVVQDEAADRRLRQRSESHADQSAHRRADPVHGVGIKPGQQRDHVGDVGRHLIAHRILQEIGLTAPDDVRTDDPIDVAERARERVEVAPLSAQPVDADEHPAVVGIAPLPVRHAVQAARIQALDMAQIRFGHACSRRKERIRTAGSASSRAYRPARHVRRWKTGTTSHAVSDFVTAGQGPPKRPANLRKIRVVTNRISHEHCPQHARRPHRCRRR